MVQNNNPEETQIQAAPAAKESPALSEANGGNPSRRKTFMLILLALIVLGACAGGLWLWLTWDYVSTDDAFVDAHIIYVSPQVAAHVNKVLVLDNQFVKKGTPLVQLDPRDFQAALDRAEAALQIARANHRASKYGLALIHRTSRAAVDQALAQIRIARSQIAQARATLAEAQSNLLSAKANVTAAQAAVARSKAQVLADSATAIKAQQDYKRYAKLLKSGDVTPSQLETYRAAAVSAQAYVVADRTEVMAKHAMVDQAHAAVAAARQSVNAAQAALARSLAGLILAKAQLSSVNVVPQQVGKQSSNVSAGSATIAELKAEVEQAELNLSYCDIDAPVSGYVTRKIVEPGDYVTTGQNLLAIVRPKMWVIANFKETDLTHMKPGDPATISIDAYPNVNFKGYVQSIQAGTGAKFSLLPPENATGNYVKVVQRVPVKILFKDLPAKLPYLAAGMSAVPEVKVR